MKDKNKKDYHQDHIILGLICHDALRVAVCDVTDTVRTAQKQHNLDPLATITLGRALAGAALMGSTLKAEDAFVQCHFKGDGPIGSVFAEYIAPASLRGFVSHPQLSQALPPGVSLPDSVGEAVGRNGMLTVRIGQKKGQKVHTGICELRSGEIAEDLAYYYLESEQVPTILGAGVTLSAEGAVLGAGGVLIQKLGGCEVDASILEQLEYKVRHSLPVSQKLAQGEAPKAILAEITELEATVASFEAKPLGFHCFCNRTRMAMALRSLGEAELRSIKADAGEISTFCHFCATTYQFDLDELIDQ